MAAQVALVSAKHKMFAVPFDQGMANLIPDARRFAHPQHGEMLLLPHTVDTTRLARNLGFATPAPILTQYDWNSDTPFRTQRVTAALLTMQPRAFVLSEMGTGKTRAALHAANFMMLDGIIKRILVAAPLSTLLQVWDLEVMQYFNHLDTSILHGTKKQRLKALARDAQVYIINHDGVEVILAELMARDDIDAVIIDEIASYRNKSTDRWAAMNQLVNERKPPVKFAWGMTGSPTPNEPPDAWGQCRLLVPRRVTPYSKQFKRITMRQVSTFKWIPRPNANDIVFDVMQPSVRYTRDECVELPPVSYRDLDAALSPHQTKVYNELLRKLVAGFAEGTVTAANEGVLMSKLLQVACGWVYTTDRHVVSLDNKPRLDALLEIVEEASGKVIVFADFIHAAHNLWEYLTQNKVQTGLVTGQTPPGVRNLIFSAFQNHDSPRVLVAHPKCMAHGLTLTAANTIVWFTPTTSLETYEQACARIIRPGQTRKSLVIHLTGTAVETKLYRRLRQKASLQGALLEMFETAQEIK